MQTRKIAYPLVISLLLVGCSGGDTATNPLADGLAPSFATVPYDCSSQTEIPLSECEALVDFYNSTGGPDWTNSDGWLTSDLPCSWHGVGCSGRLWGLELTNNNLTGSIPESIGQLLSLDLLYLFGNQLTGAIPGNLGELPGLYLLDLSRNQLTGPIPVELANRGFMRVSLSSNRLSGSIPEGFFTHHIEFLDLSNNELSGTLPPIGGEMEYLDLSSNRLSGPIPDVFKDFWNLHELDLSSNQFTGPIPSSLGGDAPPPLWHLDLSSNQLTGPIPAGLVETGYLSRLFLTSNQLSGLVPEGVAAWGGENEPRCVFVPPGNEGLYLLNTQAYQDADLDGDGRICGLALPSTAAAIAANLVSHLQALRSTGVLKRGQENRLRTTVDQALKKAEKGQYRLAVRRTRAFLRTVDRLVARGVLTEEQAEPLIARATMVLEIWSEM